MEKNICAPKKWWEFIDYVRIWKFAVVTSSRYDPGIRFEGLKEATNSLGTDRVPAEKQTDSYRIRV
jgi:hypothetical protein